MSTSRTTQVDVTVAGGSVVVANGSIIDAEVDLAADRIAAVRPRPTTPPTASTVIDAGGRLVAPGFVDLQINGGWGHDFTSDPSTIGDVAARLPSTGVSTFVPTIVTAAPDRRRAAIAAVGALATRDLADDAVRADPVGLHFEGPAISPRRPGAHDREWIGLPTADEVATWTRSNGVAIVTLAPDLEGALELIGPLVDAGVVVSIGHTGCSADQFAAARAAGATLVTHLFNAMAAFDHRDPGPIGATLADGDVRAGLICDGVHSDPIAVEMAWRSLGPDRIVLVTDAVAALGLDTDRTALGATEVVINETSVRLPDGTLAGSKLSLDRAVRNLVAMTGCAPADALRAASTTPADVLGLTDRGRIEPGARADLLVLDGDLHVQQTIIGGQHAWKS